MQALPCKKPEETSAFSGKIPEILDNDNFLTILREKSPMEFT
jgi:hypothetical protein